MKIRITSDSTCDLGEHVQKRDIGIMPLQVNLGENAYRDGVDIDPDFIYSHYEKTGQLPKTSAVNLVDFEEFFAKHTSEGSAVILFTISAEMSSTYNNARLAAEEFENVYVIDTRNLSTGGGLLVVSAAVMASGWVFPAAPTSMRRAPGERSWLNAEERILKGRQSPGYSFSRVACNFSPRERFSCQVL